MIKLAKENSNHQLVVRFNAAAAQQKAREQEIIDAVLAEGRLRMKEEAEMFRRVVRLLVVVLAVGLVVLWGVL